MTRNQQSRLDFGRLYLVDDCYRESMRWLNEAYHSAGNLVAAGATKVDHSDLAKMFEPGGARHMRLKTTMALASLNSSSFEIRRSALLPIAECFGLSVCDPLPPISDKDRATTAEAVIDSLGPIAQDAYRRALGRSR